MDLNCERTSFTIQKIKNEHEQLREFTESTEGNL